MILFSFPLGGCVNDVDKQIIKDANTCISFSITHRQSPISKMVSENVRLSQELFLMHKFV